MQKILLLIAILVSLSINAIAQNATNFVANDCNGVSHNLFNELDSGKVIVLSWVMPCASCTGPALTAYNIVTYYQTQFPDQVLYYMIDDYANTSCSSLQSWANSKGINGSRYSYFFVDASIKMSDYGADGMPKTIVVGGSSHKVFYNENNSLDPDAMMTAIEIALNSTGIDPVLSKNKMSLYPNPGEGVFTFQINSPISKKVDIAVFDISGKKVAEIPSELKQGVNNIQLSLAFLADGLYFIKTNPDAEIIKFVISR